MQVPLGAPFLSRLRPAHCLSVAALTLRSLRCREEDEMSRLPPGPGFAGGWAGRWVAMSASQEAVAVPRLVPAPHRYPGAPWGQGAGGFLVTA